MPILNVDHVKCPPRKTVLWRYMSLTKWLSLVTSGDLFFCRLDLVGDSHEGYLPPPGRIALTADSHLFPGYNASDTIKILHHMAWASRFHLYVNCWTMNPVESMAMWKLYAPTQEAVAIRTTVGKLFDALENQDSKIYAGAVEYHDADTRLEFHDFVQLIYLKRRAFEYEREFRISQVSLTLQQSSELTTFSLDPKAIPLGRPVAVKFNDFIDVVKIGPGCPPWVSQLVYEMSARLAPELAIEPSELDAAPEWDVPVEPEIYLVNRPNEGSVRAHVERPNS
jgi:Protein of unknown function (DUF2971)